MAYSYDYDYFEDMGELIKALEERSEYEVVAIFPWKEFVYVILRRHYYTD